jgi:ABC-type uncharacterized transport system substrate-binding protein
MTVILAFGSAAMEPLFQAARNVPIAFALVPDLVGAGFVDSLPRPGSNATGFYAVRIRHQLLAASCGHFQLGRV